MPSPDPVKRNKFKSDYKLRERAKRKLSIHQYLKDNNLGCIDCNEKDVIVLDFDHVRGKKVKNIANMVNDCLPWETILEEIKKCDVRCANCHRRKTAKELGFWKQLV